MNTTHSTPYVVLMEDPIIHTEDNPFCGDETCPCMEELYAIIEQELDDWEPPYSRADEQAELATADYYDELGRQM